MAGKKKKKSVYLLVDDEASSTDGSESDIIAREAAEAEEEGYGIDDDDGFIDGSVVDNGEQDQEGYEHYLKRRKGAAGDIGRDEEEEGRDGEKEEEEALLHEDSSDAAQEEFDRPTNDDEVGKAEGLSDLEDLESNEKLKEMLMRAQLHSEICNEQILLDMGAAASSDESEVGDDEPDAKPKQTDKLAAVLAPWERGGEEEITSHHLENEPPSKRQRTENSDNVQDHQNSSFWRNHQLKSGNANKKTLTGAKRANRQGPAFDAEGNPLPGTERSTKFCRLLGKNDKSLRLFPHQMEGARWLFSLAFNGFNGILADEMGLGKTVQIIAFLACLIQEDVVGPHLIVAPLSTLSNWESEFRRWLPALPVCVYHGKAAERKALRVAIRERMKDIHQDQEGGGNGDGHKDPAENEMELEDLDDLRLGNKRTKTTEKKKKKKEKKEKSSKKRKKKETISNIGLQTLAKGKGCVVITSYEMVLADDCPFADDEYKWGMMVVDEAHRLKNFECVLIKHLKRLHVENRYLLTGTPLQNNMSELWSILNFVKPDVFSSLDEFQQWFTIDALDHRGDEEADASHRNRLRDNIIAAKSNAEPADDNDGGMASRSSSPPSQKKSALLDEKSSDHGGAGAESAPTAPEEEVPSSLAVDSTQLLNATTASGVFGSPSFSSAVSQTTGWQPSQKLARNSTAMRSLTSSEATVHIVAKMHRILRPFLLRRTKDEIPDLRLPKKVEVVLHCPLNTEQQKAYDYVQRHEWYAKARLIHLRKVCCHPFLFPELDPFHEAVMKQQFFDTEKSLYWPALVAASSKLTMLHHMLPKLYKAGHKVLLFSQLTSVLDILEDYLIHEPSKYPYERLDGSHNLDARKASLAKFAAGSTPVNAGSPNFPSGVGKDEGGGSFLFLISTRAGGHGINLTAADTVILFDSDFNPHNDLQAIDRCHRIGQKADPVVVYRLLCPHTVEETVFSISLKKIKLEKLLIESGKFNRRGDRTSTTGRPSTTTTAGGPLDATATAVVGSPVTPLPTTATTTTTTTAGGGPFLVTEKSREEVAENGRPSEERPQQQQPGKEDQEAIELLKEDFRAIMDLKFGDLEFRDTKLGAEAEVKKKGRGREKIEKPTILTKRRRKVSDTAHRTERELKNMYADVDTTILPPFLGEEQLTKLCLDRKWLAAGGAGTVEEQQVLQHRKEQDGGQQ